MHKIMVLHYLVDKMRGSGREKAGLNGREWAEPAAPLANGTPMH